MSDFIRDQSPVAYISAKPIMQESDNILEQVIEFTREAHGEQRRKYSPDHYIVHPIRVMELVKKHTDDIAVLSAAVMHDVLEDTEITEEELGEFLSKTMNKPDADRTLTLVVELTDVYIKRDYPNLNRRVRKEKEVQRMEKTSSDAQTIKYADIIDNSAEIAEHDPDFARVFLYECRNLLRKMKNGNKQLYDLAVEKVEGGIKKLKSGSLHRRHK